MRFSVWSSLVISVCSALVLVGAASAHVSIDPQRVDTKAEVDLVFSVPNEDDAVGIDHVTLGIPADFELDDAEAKPGWTQSRTGQAITYRVGLDVASIDTEDTDARSLGKAALVIAIVAAVLALVALFAWVYRWIRPGPA